MIARLTICGALALGAGAAAVHVQGGGCCLARAASCALGLDEGCAGASDADAPRGDYVEARSASVFAGACHYGGEYTVAGRRALVGLAFEGGAWDGTPLAGVEAVLVLGADRNLAEADAARRSVLLVDEGASAAQREALVGLLRARFGERLGELGELRRLPVEVARAGEAYSLRAGDVVAVEGALLADRACCSMPSNRWYEPLLPAGEVVVGNSRTLRCAAVASVGEAWSRAGENDAFVGRFLW